MRLRFFKNINAPKSNNTQEVRVTSEKNTFTRDFQDFESTNSATGGMTGSIQTKDVKNNNHLHQLKFPIFKANWDRRIKANGVDRENFGEVVAAQIGRKLLDEFLCPNVFPVYGPIGACVASEYLGSRKDPAQTLDKFAEEKFNVRRTNKHVKVVPSNPDEKNGELSFKYAPLLKKDLCKAIVLSAVLGDHDVNPGNMMIFRHNGELRLARIDFGHAFNDLLKCHKINGGEVRDKNNPLLDFFNRSEVGGIMGDSSKLWRDYPNLIPCDAMVEALREMSNDFDKHVEEGVSNAKRHFEGLIKDMENKKDLKNIEHVKKSLQAICPEIDLDSLVSSTQSFGASTKSANLSALNPIFDNIQRFVKKQGQNLNQVANVMELQLAIDKALKSKGGLTTISSLISKDFPKTGDKIHWIKTDVKKKAEICTLEDFIAKRVKALVKEEPKKKQEIKNNAHYILTSCKLNPKSNLKDSIKSLKRDTERGAMHSTNAITR